MISHIYIILEWENPLLPLSQRNILMIKDSIKTMKKQYPCELLILSNSEEYVFLSDVPAVYKQVILEEEIQSVSHSHKEDISVLWIHCSHHQHQYKTLNQSFPLQSGVHHYHLDLNPPANIRKNQAQKSIIIRADGGQTRGIGHLHRALSLYSLLQDQGCNINLVTLDTPEMNFGNIMFTRYGIPFTTVSNEEDFILYLKNKTNSLLILDILNTSPDFILELKPYVSSIISFENLDDSIQQCDLVINDLYYRSDLQIPQQLCGIDFALLSPSFYNISQKNLFRNHVQHILITLGGVEVGVNSSKILDALTRLSFQGKVTLIQNIIPSDILSQQYPFQLEHRRQVTYMPWYMSDVDLAISGYGRTVLELIYMGVPTITLAHNHRELLHTHIQTSYGVIGLGLGEFLISEAWEHYLSLLIHNTSTRQWLYSNTMTTGQRLSNQSVINHILEFV